MNEKNEFINLKNALIAAFKKSFLKFNLLEEKDIHSIKEIYTTDDLHREIKKIRNKLEEKYSINNNNEIQQYFQYINLNKTIKFVKSIDINNDSRKNVDFIAIDNNNSKIDVQSKFITILDDNVNKDIISEEKKVKNKRLKKEYCITIREFIEKIKNYISKIIHDEKYHGINHFWFITKYKWSTNFNVKFLEKIISSKLFEVIGNKKINILLFVYLNDKVCYFNFNEIKKRKMFFCGNINNILDEKICILYTNSFFIPSDANYPMEILYNFCDILKTTKIKINELIEKDISNDEFANQRYKIYREFLSSTKKYICINLCTPFSLTISSYDEKNQLYMYHNTYPSIYFEHINVDVLKELEKDLLNCCQNLFTSNRQEIKKINKMYHIIDEQKINSCITSIIIYIFKNVFFDDKKICELLNIIKRIINYPAYI